MFGLRTKCDGGRLNTFLVLANRTGSGCRVAQKENPLYRNGVRDWKIVDNVVCSYDL